MDIASFFGAESLDPGFRRDDGVGWIRERHAFPKYLVIPAKAGIQ
nr:hypothetical protein [Luteimonas sp. XNQY3]